MDHSYEPRVVEGFLGSAAAVTKAFVVGPRGDKGGAGARVDLSTVQGRPGQEFTLTASATDASVAQVAGGDYSAPRDVIVTAEMGEEKDETSSTYLLGYDFGASCILARARRAFRGARGTAGRVAATWFSAGNHVRLDADADVGSRGITWGTLTLHDPADQANATAVNLIEREAGFVVRPFTAPSATAAFGGGVELGDSGWRLDAAFDLNALTPYASVSRSLAAGVGGPAFDGPATVGLHVAPADAVVMATFELGDKTGDADAGVAFGGGRSGRHPVKAFVRGRVAKGGGGGWRPAVRDASFGLMVEGWPFGGLF